MCIRYLSREQKPVDDLGILDKSKTERYPKGYYKKDNKCKYKKLLICKKVSVMKTDRQQND